MKVLHQYLQYVPDVQEGEHGICTTIEGTIVSLAELDKLFVTLVLCLREDSGDTFGGHPQKIYYNAFADALPKACKQPICINCQYVQMWQLTYMETSFLYEATEEAGSSEPFK